MQRKTRAQLAEEQPPPRRANKFTATGHVLASRKYRTNTTSDPVTNTDQIWPSGELQHVGALPHASSRPLHRDGGAQRGGVSCEIGNCRPLSGAGRGRRAFVGDVTKPGGGVSLHCTPFVLPLEWIFGWRSPPGEW